MGTTLSRQAARAAHSVLGFVSLSTCATPFPPSRALAATSVATPVHRPALVFRLNVEFKIMPKVVFREYAKSFEPAEPASKVSNQLAPQAFRGVSRPPQRPSLCRVWEESIENDKSNRWGPTWP